MKFKIFSAPPHVWISIVIIVIFVTGFFSSISDRPTNPEKLLQDCIKEVHAEKESCLNGGPLNGVFKTKSRIEACDEIFVREKKNCESLK